MVGRGRCRSLCVQPPMQQELRFCLHTLRPLLKCNYPESYSDAELATNHARPIHKRGLTKHRPKKKACDQKKLCLSRPCMFILCRPYLFFEYKRERTSAHCRAGSKIDSNLRVANARSTTQLIAKKSCALEVRKVAAASRCCIRRNSTLLHFAAVRDCCIWSNRYKSNKVVLHE